MASHDKSLVLKLLGDIPGAGSGNLNPRLGENGARDQHVRDIDGSVERVQESIGEVQRGRHVVRNTRDGVKLGRSFLGLPDTEELNQEVVGEARVQHLADKEDVRRKSRLQHDGHVGGVEETDGVGSTCTTLAGRLDWDLDPETLKVDDGGEDKKSGNQVHDVGQVLSIERLLESALLVGPGEEQVEEGNDCSLEFRSTASVDGGRGESLPDNGLADVGGNEKRDTASKTVSLLEELIEENDNQASNNQLEDQEEDNASAEVRWLTVETGEDVDSSLAHGQDDSEELLRSLVELAVRLQVEVDIDQVGTSQELENHTGGDNRGNTQFHQGSTVTRHHHPQPVYRIGAVRGHNAIQWHLAHDQEYQEG